jgi:hypothetical protein
MRKINIIFAAAFAGAILLGAVNVFMAVDVAKPVSAASVDKVDKGVINKDSINVVDKKGTDTVGKQEINMVRRGRKIQVDGFLLEWRGADANVWPGSDWRWDAVSTADGVAGYVSLPAGVVAGGNKGIDTGNASSVNRDNNGSANSDWVFELKAVNTGKSLEINLPGRPSGKYFAFDKEDFDAGGPLTAEWVVPWEFFDDGDGEDSAAYKLSISASGKTGGGALHTLVLTVAVPEEPRAPSGPLTRLSMIVIIAALTVTLAVIRRRQMRERL